MKQLFPNLSLSQRYALFLFGVIAALLISSHFVFSSVVESGLRDMYTQRLERSARVMSHYANVHLMRKANEIGAVVNSPGFVRAVSSGDSSAIRQEAPYYQRLLNATVFIIEDSKHNIVYGLRGPDYPDGIDRMAQVEINRILDEEAPSVSPHYVLNGGELLELFAVDVTGDSSEHLGRVIFGDRISNFMTSDLELLTGFDVVIRYDSNVVANTESQLSQQFICDSGCLEMTSASEGVVEMDFQEQKILSFTMHDETVNASITFFGSLDESVTPIMSRIRWSLIVLALIGGTLAMAAVYFFTSQRIGRQVDRLVSATEEIASGNLDFCLVPQSNDEFGYLTRMVENMRASLQKHREELLKAHQEKLDAERLAAVGKSATGIIHDFKSPMAVIRGAMELLQLRYADDEKIAQQSARVVQQIDAMNSLTQDVLEFSRGRFELNLSASNLSEYLGDAVSSHRESFVERGLALELAEGPPVTVRLDKTRFRRVLDNILGNAREALTPTSSVTVSWTEQETDGAIKLVIEDDGPGIPEDILPTLFEPFVTSGKEGGTGLGLSIAQKIVEAHGFTITAGNKAEGGAKFVVSVPAAMIVDEPDQKLHPSVEKRES